ncbi:WapI family immunity protein [Pseudoneobacillus sp. C159]
MIENILFKGNIGYLLIKLVKVYPCKNGGYDVEGKIEIKSGNYAVIGQLWFSIDDLTKFCNQLEHCLRSKTEEAVFWNYNFNLKISVRVSPSGTFIIYGFFKENTHLENELSFELETNRMELAKTLENLQNIVQFYSETAE